MRRILMATIAGALAFSTATPATAHQPVAILNTDTTAEKGPLLVDGTISFATRATFTKAGQTRAFRAGLKEGDQLSVQYLIFDRKPESGMKSKQLPQLVITSPTGKKISIKFTERTKFFEPYSQTKYLYLSRYSAPAEPGIYSFVATSRAKASITIAVGDREVKGEVLRGPAPTPIPTPTTSQAAATPAPEPVKTQEALYTMAKVKENDSASSCWSVINGNVYNLTKWISSHPGGASAIRGLCGTDGTSSFNARHSGQSNPTSTLAGYLLGPLEK